MARLILAGLRARLAPAVMLFLLAALASGAAAVTPGYLIGALDRTVDAAVRAAPLDQAVVSATATRRPTTDPAAVLAPSMFTVRRELARPGLTFVSGWAMDGLVGQAPATLIYRDGMCDHLTVTGACPGTKGQALISELTARRLGLTLGSPFDFDNRDQLESPGRLTVGGVYRVDDPADRYWGRFGAASPGGRGEPVYAGQETIGTVPIKQMYAVVEGIVAPELFRRAEPFGRRTEIRAGLEQLRLSGFSVYDRLDGIADRIAADRNLIIVGVPIAAAQLLLVCLFALGVAVRHTGTARAPDLGLLKLRGAGRVRLWLLAGGQVAGAVLAGALVGVAVAVLSPNPGPALLAVGAVVLGSLATALLADRRLFATPVVDLLRQVPARSGWRAGAIEAVAVVLALAAGYQVRAVSAGDGSAAGLALLAAPLIALAAAVIGGRAVPVIARLLGERALAAGRPAAALAALDIARRPGVPRLVALVGVATALAGTGVVGWDSAATARAERAAVMLGADRVVTVRAANRAQLLAATRAADPDGRFALAAVQSRAIAASGPGAAVPALAIDTTRLAAVARWRPEYGPGPAALAAALRPPAAGSVLVDGTALEIDLSGAPPQPAPPAPPRDPGDEGPRRPQAVLPLQIPPPGPGVLLWLQVRLGTAAGPGSSVEVPVEPGRHTVRVGLPDCAAGCRLLGFEFTRTAFALTPMVGAGAVVHQVRQSGPDRVVADAGVLADAGRWRAPASAGTSALLISHRPDGLALQALPRAADTPVQLPYAVQVADSPLPLPIAVAGPLGAERRLGTRLLAPFNDRDLPLRVAVRSALLPRLGESGLLVDLEYADRAAGDLRSGESMQVWLGPAAPRDALDRLRRAGLDVIAVESLSSRVARYAAEGTPTALRLQVTGALVGLLLAAGCVVLVAAVDRPTRRRELGALRDQGVAPRVLRRAVAGGYAALVALAAAVGGVAAVASLTVADVSLPLFNDGWTGLPPPPVSAGALALLVAGIAGVLGGATWCAARPLAPGPAQAEPARTSS